MDSKKRAAGDNAIIVGDLQTSTVPSLQASQKFSWQMTIQTSMKLMPQSDICHTNKAILEIKITGFLPFSKI